MNFSEVSLSKATIQTKHLLENIQSFKQLLTPDTKFMAVIKANAYSHGAVPLAREMEENRAADYFGVAQLSEALQLRAEKIKTPILVFNAMRAEDIERAIQEEITMTVFSEVVAKKIVQTAEALEKTAKVHLKIDTGMARLGVTTFSEAFAVYEALASSFVDIEGIYTHFADAYEETPESFTHEQFSRYQTILKQLEEHGVDFTIRHTCNTAATINFPDYHLDMVRVGLGLYGYDPTVGAESKMALTPLETVQTTVTHIKDFPAAESVGYNRTYFSKKEMKIATIAIGYADGVAKSLSNKGFFTYKGEQLPIIGAVCMDQIMLDCTDVPALEVGDVVTYFGKNTDGHLTAQEVATIAGESAYDLLCRIGHRVERVYE
jgi:alanine racemase